MFKDTKSHDFVYLQLLSVLNIFFAGVIELSKGTITELYKNLSLETLSRQQQIEFDKISDLTSHINLNMTPSMLSNLDRKAKYNAENNDKVKETHEFFKKLSDEKEFKRKRIEDILEPYKHKKIWKPYVFLRVQDAQTIENETKNEIDDFLKTAPELDKKDVAATNQKRDDYYNKLFDDITNEGDSRQTIDDGIKTEDIFIDDDYRLMMMMHKRQKICDYMLDEVGQNDILFKRELVDNTPNYSFPLEPLQTFSDILLPKARTKLAKKKFKKYQKLRENEEIVKNAGKRALQELKNAKYIQTDNTKTVNYDDDVNIDDLATAEYNSKTTMN